MSQETAKYYLLEAIASIESAVRWLEVPQESTIAITRIFEARDRTKEALRALGELRD